MINKALIVIAGSMILFFSSCTVDCDYTCVDYDGWIETGSAKVRASKCDDCDFPRVNSWQNLGYDCICSE